MSTGIQADPAKRGIVITGGFKPPIEAVMHELKNAQCIIAADSGFDYAVEHGIQVDLVVGDLDSIRSHDALRRIADDRIRKYSHDEKEETDTEIGVRFLHEGGYQTITIIGGGGGRIDHLYGIFVLFDRPHMPNVWYTDTAVIYGIDGAFQLHNIRGERISLFPVGMEISRMESRGLKWPLDSLSWKKGDLGISNVAIADSVEIRMRSGRLILIRDLGTSVEDSLNEDMR